MYDSVRNELALYRVKRDWCILITIKKKQNPGFVIFCLVKPIFGGKIQLCVRR